MKFDWTDWLLLPFAPFILLYWSINPPTAQNSQPAEHYQRLQ